MKVVGVAPDANIFRSWVEASISMPIQVRQIYPENWHVKDVSLLGPNFAASTDLAELLNADVIVTDSWPSEAHEEQMREYRISASVLAKCRPDVIFLPCPPVSRERKSLLMQCIIQLARVPLQRLIFYTRKTPCSNGSSHKPV